MQAERPVEIYPKGPLKANRKAYLSPLSWFENVAIYSGKCRDLRNNGFLPIISSFVITP
jgi:hypothetical protein